MNLKAMWELEHMGDEFDAEIARRIKACPSWSDANLAGELERCCRHYCYYDATADYMPALVAESARRLRKRCPKPKRP